ncbi:universal stress protein UspA [Croceivirga lutea]|uniref:universal stress protein n=1 Tax=Croceivirga lutea TaxID=1775167 RepID=UPI00163A67F6|nr:universal stress protein [Croceivirga lutea]GGG43127.1 universal stress protein UspA [Croceivirga lutea]
MRTVLIPTDFSTNARHAIDYALLLHKNEPTIFYFLHAYADKVYSTLKSDGNGNIVTQKKVIKQHTELKLNKLVTEIKSKTNNPKHTYEAVLAFESLVDVVNDFVKQIDVDLIIMGTQGQTSNKKITFGSNTVQVFKYVQCPVLAVPEDYIFEQPKKVLFPTDYMLPYKLRELKLLRDIAVAFKSEVHCLYISDFENLSQRQLKNQKYILDVLYDANLFFDRIPSKHRVEAILKHVTNKEIDILVMINSRHSFLEDMLYRSTVDELGLNIKTPFLVMQNLPR